MFVEGLGRSVGAEETVEAGEVRVLLTCPCGPPSLGQLKSDLLGWLRLRD